jgi:ubiquitin-like domain-containing CTD phosphatase 1
MHSPTGAFSLQRPFLHEFLSSAYHHYDIVIWSATGKKWVEVKMKELGVLSHPEYKVTCMLDHSAMVTVSMERYGVFDCKPLAFLWWVEIASHSLLRNDL